MLGHVAQSVGGALPGGAIPLIGLKSLNVLAVQQFQNSNGATGSFVCPAKTVQVYMQAWGWGGFRLNANPGGGGSAWAADVVDAIAGDGGNYTLPPLDLSVAGRALNAIVSLRGVTVSAESGQNNQGTTPGGGGRIANSIGRWREAGGAGGLPGSGASAGQAGTANNQQNAGGGAGAGHFTPGGRGGDFNGTGSSPGGGSGGGANNGAGGLPTILLYFLGDAL